MAQYELNIQDYLRIFKRRRWIIILTFVFILISVLVFTSIQTPVYQASATVKVEPGLAIPGFATELGGDLTALKTEVKIIKSTLVAERTARKLGLIAGALTQDEKETITQRVQQKIGAERQGDTNLISITATSSDPMETAGLANAAAEVYIEMGIEDRSRRAKELRGFIETQMGDAEAKLRQSEDTLRSFAEKSGVKGVGGYLSQRLVELQNHKSELLKIYTEQHPEVQTANQQIGSIEKQMRTLPAEELEYARLMRVVNINEELYMLLAKRYKESQISEADRVQSAFVITPAVVPQKPVKPNRPMNVSVGIFLGVFLGFVFALVMENLDTSIGTIEDVEKYLELPVLGIVPHIDIDARAFTSLALKKGPKERRLAALRSKLIIYHSEKSAFVEAYHTLRTNLKFPTGVLVFTSAGIGEGKTTTSTNFALAAALTGIKTLLIETDLRRPSLHWLFGVARNPGFSDAVIGSHPWKDVLRGTTDFLLSGIGAEKIMQMPGIENLSLMTSGSVTLNPVDILSASNTARVIGELSKEFELVVMDCPPVLLFADALILSGYATGTIIVYRAGRMSRHALKRAKDQLANVKANVLGVAFNNVHTSEIGTYFGYNYSYKYYASDPGKAP